MNPPEPRIRALQSQLVLRFVDALPPAERDAIRARVGAAALEEIAAPVSLAWCPMALHMRLSDALRDEIGPERALAAWVSIMTASFERPLLRSFVEMSTNLFGVTPTSLVRQSERIYAQLTRDLGTIRVLPTRGPTEAALALVGFPAHLYNFDCYVEGVQGGIAAALPLAGARGEVTVTRRDPARGEAEYHLTWTMLAGR